MKPAIHNLLTQLHDTFGDDKPSPEVAHLMQDMERHINQWDTATPENDIAHAAEALAAELEVKHPAASAVVQKIIEALNNIGI